jgi:hypothetical protein
MKKLGNRLYWIGFVSGILFAFAGLYIAYLIDNRRTEIVEVTKIGVEGAVPIIRHYKLPGQKPREWNREIYYEDIDSMTITKWKTMSSKERVEAIRRSFLFDPDVDWDSYTDEEQERMLLNNAFVEWN